MNMRLTKFSLGLVAVTIMLLAVSGYSSAETSTIQPGDTYQVTVQANERVTFSYVWSTSSSVHFVITDPDGDVIKDVTSMISIDEVHFTKTGTYTLRWTNSGTTAVTLDYTLNPFKPFQEELSWLFWAAVITGIVILVVIILVVIVVVTKKKPQQGLQQGPPLYAAQVAATGMCPKCGRQVDTSAAFCEKCGARLK